MKETKRTAKVKCPKCSHQTEVEVPQKACLSMYKCDSCQQTISVPEDSDNCCVVCEYSDNECPMPNKHKKS